MNMVSKQVQALGHTPAGIKEGLRERRVHGSGMAQTLALKGTASQRGFCEVSGVDALAEKNKVSQEEHSDMQVLVAVYLHQTLC